jgi:hypothetical protein
MTTKTNGVIGLSLGILMLAVLGFTSPFASAAALTQDTDTETNDDNAAIVGTAKLTESEAKTVATKAYTGNGTFKDIELEMDNNVLVYTSEFTEGSNDVDVKVDANTGAVVTIESNAADSANDDEGDSVTAASTTAALSEKMTTMIDLLNQLIALLKAKIV